MMSMSLTLLRLNQLIEYTLLDIELILATRNRHAKLVRIVHEGL